MKRAIWAAVFIAVAAVAAVRVQPLLRHPVELWSLWREHPAAHLPMPIAGARATNSWGSPRPGGRGHQGVDLFAARGFPVVSTTHGIVIKVGTNRLGGNVVKVLGPGLEWHYYAHLDRYGAFHPGDVVRAGDVLGYVGNTGDARGTPFHLHYGIYSRLGIAQNPYPRLTASSRSW